MQGKRSCEAKRRFVNLCLLDFYTLMCLFGAVARAMRRSSGFSSDGSAPFRHARAEHCTSGWQEGLLKLVAAIKLEGVELRALAEPSLQDHGRMKRLDSSKKSWVILQHT